MSRAVPRPLVIVLGGTAEARTLAATLEDRGLARVARARELAEADAEGAVAVLDARHPFSPGATACDLPVIRLLRPEWRPAARDNWTEVRDGVEAVAVIPQRATVFVATGRGRLQELAGLRGRTVWWRRRGEVVSAFPFDAGGWLTEEGPFTEAEERALFRRLGIDWLIVQNAGGAGARPKLLAARDLGVRVAMIRRPPPPPDAVATVEAALDRLRGALVIARGTPAP